MVKNNKNNSSNSLVFGRWPQTKMKPPSCATRSANRQNKQQFLWSAQDIFSQQVTQLSTLSQSKLDSNPLIRQNADEDN